MIVSTLRWWWAEVRWCVKTTGYQIRPYDMLADRRRWFWQPRQRCGWTGWVGPRRR